MNHGAKPIKRKQVQTHFSGWRAPCNVLRYVEAILWWRVLQLSRLGELTTMPENKARRVLPVVRNGPYNRKKSMVDQTQRQSVLPVKDTFVKPIGLRARSSSAVVALSQPSSIQGALVQRPVLPRRSRRQSPMLPLLSLVAPHQQLWYTWSGMSLVVGLSVASSHVVLHRY